MFWIAGIVVGLGLAAVAGSVVVSWRRPELGLLDGRLRPCPETPNCVCSEQRPTDAGQFIEPLSIVSDRSDAWSRAVATVRRMPGARVVTEAADYVHVEFITPWLRYVDDVELRRDDAAGVIHVRSASRVGRSDLGVNRARIEALRALLAMSNAPHPIAARSEP